MLFHKVTEKEKLSQDNFLMLSSLSDVIIYNLCDQVYLNVINV